MRRESTTPAERTGALLLEALSLALGGTRLWTVSLTVAPGEVASVVGPSGSGKSSLLAAIAGVLSPAFRVEGRVRLGGRDLLPLPPEARGVGLMFQDDLLFPHLSVADNVAFGLDPEVRGRAQRAEAVEQALARAGLAGLEGRDPRTLSGGQRARVALLRAVLAAPRALLLDEPFSRLDPALRDATRDWVLAEIRRCAIPALLVSHDREDVAAAGGPLLDLGRPQPSTD